MLGSRQIQGREGGAGPPSSPPPKSQRLSLFKKTTDRRLHPLDLPAAQHGAFTGIASGEHGGESDIHVSALRYVLLRRICLLADSLSICTVLNIEFHTSYFTCNIALSHLQHTPNSLFFPINTCYSHLQHLPAP